jgi:hypothetical protein
MNDEVCGFSVVVRLERRAAQLPKQENRNSVPALPQIIKCSKT